ncbi:hypothetical protein KAI12_03170 [Candidatus Bathyarchaeota archaeon]|nr:hypothetical protein [Candidatus Bathyarchaeota archaeon]
MKETKFSVYSFHPPEYKASFYNMFDEEMRKGNLRLMKRIEGTASPTGLIKDMVTVIASALPIIKILYDFHKETKKKKGRVIIRKKGKNYDIESYDIEELKLILTENEKESYEHSKAKP